MQVSAGCGVTGGVMESKITGWKSNGAYSSVGVGFVEWN